MGSFSILHLLGKDDLATFSICQNLNHNKTLLEGHVYDFPSSVLIRSAWCNFRQNYRPYFHRLKILQIHDNSRLLWPVAVESVATQPRTFIDTARIRTIIINPTPSADVATATPHTGRFLQFRYFMRFATGCAAATFAFHDFLPRLTGGIILELSLCQAKSGCVPTISGLERM